MSSIGLWIAVGGSDFLIGALPTGYLIARLYGVSDVREHGSGNSGATNVARVLGLPFFFLVFFLDAGKAALMLGALRWVGATFTMQWFAAVALLLGNCYSPFLSFRGGKGVATMVGIFSVLQPYLLLWLGVVWLVALLITQTVGIASVIAALSAPVIGVLLYPHMTALIVFLVTTSSVIIVRHTSNIIGYKNRLSG